jgi:hypothetical protein
MKAHVNLISLTPTLSQREREQDWSGLTIPSPSGRGTQGEGVDATISILPRVLRQSLNRLATFGHPHTKLR